MTRLQRALVLGLCVLTAGTALLPTVLRGAAPAKPGAATAAGTRAPEAIVKDLTATQEKIQGVMPSLLAVADPEFRASAEGQKVLPLLKQMIGYFAELEKAIPEPDGQMQMRVNRYRFTALVVAYGDKEAVAGLEAKAKAGGVEGISAQSALALGNWIATSKDAAAQAKVLEEYATVAKANPTSDEIASTLGFMANVAAANADLSKKVIEVVRANLKGEGATQMLAQLDAMQAQKDMVGKPLVIAGRTSTGGKFSSEEYKGKVVLVDFWATWCGPCIAELPNVKKVYSELHAKGLEIVGLSCDTGDDVLNKFTKENEMTWTQLREESQSEADRWHPLAKKYGVDGIPTMFLIDRKGVLRYVDAREDLGTKIKALVAEGDGAAPAAK